MSTATHPARAEAPPTPRDRRPAAARVGGGALLTTTLRAVGLAAAAWVASGAPAPALPFLGTWAVLTWPALLLASLLEAPLLRALPRERARAVGVALALGLGWGLLLWGLASPFRAFGPLGVLALVLGGGLTQALLPAGGGGSRRARLAGLGLLVAVAGSALAVDPEGAYGERYVENRLDAEALAAPPALTQDPQEATDLDVAGAIARTWIRTHPPERLRFSWEEAVAVEGLLAYGERTGDPAPAAYARAWLEAHAVDAASETLWADAAAPLGPLLRVIEPDHPLVARVTAYLSDRAPRTSAGVPSHLGLLGGGALPAQAWVDSLFMHGVFLNRLHARHQVAWAGEEALRLGRGMSEHLQDPVAGLFRHAYLEFGGVTVLLPVEACFWARGNAWAAWFLVDVGLARRARGLAPDPALVRGRRALFAALRAAQDPGGLWRTDLTGEPEPGNPIETSASALILAALARGQRGGVIEATPEDTSLLARGRRALRERIRWDQGHPVVTGTSTGTNPGFRAAYRSVALDENVGHGVGAVLLALSAP